jgi:hypothetical protein
MPDTQTLLDRLALQDLATNYARGVDRIDLELLETLFTPDARVAVHHGDPSKTDPTYEMKGRDEILAGIKSIDRYRATTHFVGQQHAVVEGDHAQGETYCIAHHLHQDEGVSMNYVMSVRYQDRFERREGRWQFVERVLATDWHENRAVTPLVRR